MADTPQSHSFFEAFVRPAWVVMMVAQLLLGLALAIALIMKYYMLVFGTAVCTGDDTSIANLIRCTPVMVMVAQFLLAMAAFRFAAFMFSDTPLAFLPPLILGLVGLFLLFMSGIRPADSSWALAAVMIAFLGTVVAAVAGQYLLYTSKSVDEAETKRDAW